MRPDSLRRIDRWVGVPVCWILSALRGLAHVLGFRRGRHARPIRRVLFVQLAESGSMVLADPAMRELVTRSGAQVYCLTFAHNRESLSIAGSVAPERVITLRTDGPARLLLDACRIGARLRREGIDMIVDLELFSRSSAVLCFLSGVARRVGFHAFEGVGAYRGHLYTHPVAFNPALHVAQNYLMLVEAALGNTVPPAPRVRGDSLVPKVRQRAIEASLLAGIERRVMRHFAGVQGRGRWVFVNANASDMLPQRRWPTEKFVELIRAILARHVGVRVLLIGAKEDRATTAAICEQVADSRCVDIAGLFALHELPALFTLGEAMVSNDSGPAHFAAVTQLPVVALFGPETPVLFRPLGEAAVLSAGLACSPCVNVGNQRRTDCRDNQCMQRIPVAAVLEALERFLYRGRARSAAVAAHEPECVS